MPVKLRVCICKVLLEKFSTLDFHAVKSLGSAYKVSQSMTGLHDVDSLVCQISLMFGSERIN